MPFCRLSPGEKLFGCLAPLKNPSEQPSKLALWKICIRWTLVVIKCKKLRLAMGPFQIAIPPFEMFHLRLTVLGSGLVAQSTAVAMCFKYHLF